VVLSLAVAAVFGVVVPVAASADRRDSGPAAAQPPTVAPGQHGPLPGHLPPTRQELEVVGQLELTRQFGDIVEGQIADLSVYKGFAYLNSWDEPSCTRGGTYVADIRNPGQPAEIEFIPARRGYYHGEGAHVVTLDTPQFKGDLLAVNDEACSNDLTRPADVPISSGGFDLYDVTDPERWQPLVRNAGDRTDDGVEGPDTKPLANSYHSVFVWQDGPRAFLVGVDNTELADIDIFDITDPRNPELINDFDPLSELPPALAEQIVSEGANGQEIFHHDMVVKRIGGQMRLLASYWDAGYIQFDVSDPANPAYITDTNFDDPDPLVPNTDPPEGNAHQAEYSYDNQFFLAADEDFASHRLDEFSITSGANAGVYDSSVVPGAAPVASLPDRVLNGPTYYGGYGCDASAPIPTRASINPTLDPGEEAIVVLQRGPNPGDDPSAGADDGCFPGEKAQNAEDAGWDAVLIANRHVTGGAASDEPFCGSGGFTSPTVAVCTTHEALHLIFGQTPGFDIPYPPGHNPSLGAAGADVRATVVFDGWGYAHLYDAATSAELDAFAIPEALDERFSAGFGDLSIHEFATDPTTNLAYVSYYSGGVRVLRFSRGAGLEQVGAWIADGGSNFWGIEQFTTPQGERLIAGSDRDYGLVILRYTGPGAPVPAVTPPPATTPPPAGAPPSNRVRLRLGRYRRGRLTVVVTVNSAGRLRLGLQANLPRVGASRRVKLASTSRRITRAGTVRVTLRLSLAKRRRLGRALSTEGRVRARLNLSWKPTGGTTRRVNRRLVIRR
jgi:hypothetical protein